MNNYLVADLFCGAGGSSTGAERAIKDMGGEMILTCVNHWPIAIETHQKNHPTARHYVVDINEAAPAKLVPEGRLDLLMASPECTYYSRARGGKPVHNQARMNPMAVIKWLEILDVRCLLVENVPEFVHWGPLDDNGKPVPEKKGEYFQAWLKTIWNLGYHAEWKCLNAADYGDATTRIRFFLIARKDGVPIRWPEPTHSKTGKATMTDHRKKWRAAKEIIDWGNLGLSLFDSDWYKKHPLVKNSRRRIARGIEKFGGPMAPLFVRLLDVESEGSNDGDTDSFIMGKQGNPIYRSIDQPLPTLTTKAAPALIEPVAIPFVMGKQGHNPAYCSIEQPIPAVTCDSASILIEPVIDSVITKYYGTGDVSPIDKPLPTVTTKDRFGIINGTAKPFILQNRIRPDGDRVYDIEKPLNTVTTEHTPALVRPFLVEVNHDGIDRRIHSVEKPIGTMTTRRGSGLVQPIIVQTDQTGSNGSCTRSIEQPVPTLVTKANVAVVEPELKPVTDTTVDPRRLVYINGELYCLDIRFRMLENIELARAMGFTDNESTYEFVGNKSEVTKQIGNAVPVNMAKALVTSILSN